MSDKKDHKPVSQPTFVPAPKRIAATPEQVEAQLAALLVDVDYLCSTDNIGKARRIAIFYTELEKVYAYWKTFVTN